MGEITVALADGNEVFVNTFDTPPVLTLEIVGPLGDGAWAELTPREVKLLMVALVRAGLDLIEALES